MPIAKTLLYSFCLQQRNWIIIKSWHIVQCFNQSCKATAPLKRRLNKKENLHLHNPVDSKAVEFHIFHAASSLHDTLDAVHAVLCRTKHKLSLLIAEETGNFPEIRFFWSPLPTWKMILVLTWSRLCHLLYQASQIYSQINPKGTEGKTTRVHENYAGYLWNQGCKQMKCHFIRAYNTVWGC